MIGVETVTVQESHDLLWAAVVTGVFTFTGVFIAAVLAWQNNKTAKNTAQMATAKVTKVSNDVLAALDTGNGHSIGAGVAKQEAALALLTTQVDRMEDRQLRVERSIDRVEVRQAEASNLVTHVVGRLGAVEAKISLVADTSLQKPKEA